MATIQSNTKNTYYAILTVNETNYSVSDNYSDVYYELKLYSGSQNFSGYTIGYVVKINNEEVAYHDNSGNQTSMNANSSKLVASGTKRIYHNSDGTKRDMPISFEIWTNNYSYLPVSLSASGSMNLTDIPINANFTEHYVASTGLNSITVKWDVASSVDLAEYSVNGGGWTYASYPTYTITGLAPHTQYNIRTRITKTGGSTWTTSNYIYGTTKDIGRITSAPNFDLGNTETISFSNPSGNTIKLSIQTSTGSKFYCNDRVVSGTNYTFNFTDTELDTLYKAMENSNILNARVYLKTYYDTASHYMDYKDITITLTGNQKTGHVNIDGQWKRTKKWINVNGTWKRSVRWVNVNGIWRRCI